MVYGSTLSQTYTERTSNGVGGDRHSAAENGTVTTSEAMGGVEVLREKNFQHDKEPYFIIILSHCASSSVK
jgi:hypothetical protein